MRGRPHGMAAERRIRFRTYRSQEASAIPQTGKFGWRLLLVAFDEPSKCVRDVRPNCAHWRNSVGVEKLGPSVSLDEEGAIEFHRKIKSICIETVDQASVW